MTPRATDRQPDPGARYDSDPDHAHDAWQLLSATSRDGMDRFIYRCRECRASRRVGYPTVHPRSLAAPYPPPARLAARTVPGTAFRTAPCLLCAERVRLHSKPGTSDCYSCGALYDNLTLRLIDQRDILGHAPR